MTKIGKFYIEDVFELTGRGIVLAGRIIDGIISKGNQVEFNIENKFLRREIIGIEGIRHPNPETVNVGLVIKCLNEQENNKVKDTREILSTVYIYTEKLKLNELINWLSTKSTEDKILFNELLLSNLTIMNRAILSDEITDDQTKVESLKWSNELAHRIWNILFDLKRNENKDPEKSLGENIKFYANQSSDLAGHLGAIIKSTVNRFYYLKEKE